MRDDAVGDRFVALFLLGVLCFSPPLLAVFGGEARVAGLPLLFLYLFGAWAALIVLLMLVNRSAVRRGDAVDPPSMPGDG